MNLSDNSSFANVNESSGGKQLECSILNYIFEIFVLLYILEGSAVHFTF